jgi:hypothetical protein
MKRTIVLCVTAASLLLGQVQGQDKMSDTKMSHVASPTDKTDHAAKKKDKKSKMSTNKMSHDKMNGDKMNRNKMDDHKK